MGGPLSTLIGPDMGGLASPLGPFKRGAWLALWAPYIGGLLLLTGPCGGGPTEPYCGGLASPQSPFFWA